MSDRWNTSDIGDQTGKAALVTGANSGIGKRAAEALSRAGATVLIGCRDRSKGERAVAEIHSRHPGADLDLVEVDLADLGSVERAAEEVGSRDGGLDLLINNAGVMATPEQRTTDGFEMQLGTNHLGHFALTGRLLGKLLQAPAARIVNVSSLAHRQGSMDFGNLNWERDYSRWPAYGRSKLANLMFTFELDRRLRERDAEATSLACHPGYSATNLQSSGPSGGLLGMIQVPVMKVLNLVIAQSDERGALPTLYAATSSEAEGSDFIGPDGIQQMRGHPQKVGCSSESRDEAKQRQLWDRSVELTGVEFSPL